MMPFATPPTFVNLKPPNAPRKKKQQLDNIRRKLFAEDDVQGH